MHQQGMPVVIGIPSVETSYILSEALKVRGLDHTILNAKHYHEEELIEEAGVYGAITLLTDLTRIDAVINLSGYGVAEKRWSAKTKALIRNSRIDSTRLLVNSHQPLTGPVAKPLTNE